VKRENVNFFTNNHLYSDDFEQVCQNSRDVHLTSKTKGYIAAQMRFIHLESLRHPDRSAL
jgi:hypothetical protein